jgi:Ca-activated chloride channel family protein
MRRLKLTLALRSVAAVISSLAVVTVSGARQAKPDSGHTDKLVFNVCVADRNGAAVVGLEEQDFSALIDKRPAKIAYFTSENSPASIVLLLDTSSTMRKYDAWDEAASPLTRFVAQCNPASQFLLITFNSAPEIGADWTSDATTIDDAIAIAENRKRKQATALYDACMLAIDKAAQAPYDRKYIVLVSNGIDTSSKARADQFHRLLRGSLIPFFCIDITDPHDSFAVVGRIEMEHIASVSGGGAFFPGSRQEVPKLIGEIAQWTRHAYQIGFNVASLPKDGKYHKVAFKLRPPVQTGGTEYYVGFPDEFYSAK